MTTMIKYSLLVSQQKVCKQVSTTMESVCAAWKSLSQKTKKWAARFVGSFSAPSVGTKAENFQRVSSVPRKVETVAKCATINFSYMKC